MNEALRQIDMAIEALRHRNNPTYSLQLMVSDIVENLERTREFLVLMNQGYLK